ncbi:hypothetical protein D9758_012121 [Tetrapyrgos nigripes]|uniref:Epidermal growth factor receptor-like transmembrane-juxtamembrane segment domain-containing protein n=1 Tax=Tetrapyrgos nigripes TaxID=182062 RepID=A0A8H5CNK9_9AGAR|nr:hypothetical protein D9758_012121 [Tetrapyrgos nigripes]
MTPSEVSVDWKHLKSRVKQEKSELPRSWTRQQCLLVAPRGQFCALGLQPRPALKTRMLKLPILGSLLLGGTVLPRVLAQAANCTTDIGLKNSQGEDACAVGIQVGQICDPGFTIPPITPSHFYSATQAGKTTECICSTVYFTLLTICGVCQGVDSLPWTTYSANCTAKTVSDGNVSDSFPVPIPPGVDIPHWAFTPLLQNGSIDPLRIRADTQPDVTGTTSSTTSTPATPSSPVTTSSPAPSQSQASDSAGSGGGGTKPNAGAIAGGIVGGVVLLALLAALAFFIRRRNQNNSRGLGATPAAEFGRPQKMMQTAPTTPGWTSPETLRDSGGATMSNHYPDHSFGSRSPTPPKLYNPDDPTTFPLPISSSILRPTSPPQPTINTTFSAFPHTAPSEHGEWHPYRPDTASPEI